MSKIPVDFNKIEVLDLSKQSLKKVPENIVRYTNLKELNLSNNQITSLPIFLKELKFLEIIDVSENQIIEFPDFLFEQKELKELNISKNKIQQLSLTSDLNNIKTLEVFNIGANSLTELPSWLWKLKNLKDLRISNLDLKILPLEIGNLRKLEILSVYNCQLSSLPESIGYLNNLKELYLRKNRLNKLPNTFEKLKNLEKLSFRFNKFVKLPEVITSLNELSYLEVSDNLLTELPDNISDLKKLKNINISNNKIKRLPDSFYKLDGENLIFNFKRNPFSRAVIGNVRRMLDVSINKKNNKKTTKYTYKKETKVDKKTQPLPNENKSFERSMLGFFLFLVLFGVIVFWKPETKEEKLTKKFEKMYPVVKKRQKERFNAMLAKTKEVYIYTNDTANLKLTIKPNGYINEESFHKYAKSFKSREVNDFLENKSYGYEVSLFNERKNLEGMMYVYDSIIPSSSVKEFNLAVYYKMTDAEREVNHKTEELFSKKESRDKRKDTIYKFLSGGINFNELKTGKRDNVFKIFFMPSRVSLNRDDYFFYFSALNANISKEDFLVAVEYFEKMFIKKGDPKKHCKIRTLSVVKDETILMLD